MFDGVGLGGPTVGTWWHNTAWIAPDGQTPHPLILIDDCEKSKVRHRIRAKLVAFSRPPMKDFGKKAKHLIYLNT